MSEEGTTEGDTLAMTFTESAQKPILVTLENQVPEIKQVWIADDATGAGKLQQLKEWWRMVTTIEGAKYG